MAIHQNPTHLATPPTNCIFAQVKELDSVSRDQEILRTPEIRTLMLELGIMECQAPEESGILLWEQNTEFDLNVSYPNSHHG